MERSRLYGTSVSRIHVLGVPIDALTRREVRARCEQMLGESTLHHVVTANPELVLAASRDASVREVLGKGSLVVPDGVGLLWAARRYGKSIPERIPGVELVRDLVWLAATRGQLVWLVGGREGVATVAAAKLRQEIPGARVTAFEPAHRAEAPPEELWIRLAQALPAVLLVAYGQPRQELWIDAHRARLTACGVRIAVGVGGSFGLLSGRLPRAPRWMRERALEWLWRLLLEPRRFPRILRATVAFPFRVLRDPR